MNEKPNVTTVIHARAFNQYVVMTVEKHYFLTVAQANRHIKREIINTAVVIKIIQHLPTGPIEIVNKRYQKYEPFKQNSKAKQYLKNKN